MRCVNSDEAVSGGWTDLLILGVDGRKSVPSKRNPSYGLRPWETEAPSCSGRNRSNGENIVPAGGSHIDGAFDSLLI